MRDNEEFDKVLMTSAESYFPREKCELCGGMLIDHWYDAPRTRLVDGKVVREPVINHAISYPAVVWEKYEELVIEQVDRKIAGTWKETDEVEISIKASYARRWRSRPGNGFIYNSGV